MNEKLDITLSAEAAQNLIPCLESRIKMFDERVLERREEIARAQSEIEAFIKQRDATKITLAELTAKLNGQKPVSKNGKYQERLPKGYGDKLIAELLAHLPAGEGLTMAEIEEKTGINHATVFRTLKQAKRNNGRFVAKRKKWMLQMEGHISSHSTASATAQVLADKCCSGPLPDLESESENQSK
jgi:hypothetical protein